MTEPQPTAPSPLERYAVDWSPAGYLGAGAYGTLYKGVDKETGRSVALKFVGISGVFNHLVLREVALLAYLAQVTAGGQPFKNPAIDLISSFKLQLDTTTKDLPFAKHFAGCSSLICLVTPLYPHDCERFRTYNLVSSFTLSQMVFFWHSVVTCLRNLHRLGIAHRDVKPANLLLDSNGSAFLADLGMAKYCVYSSSLASNNYTEPEILSADHYSPISTGTTCTLVYRAPESTLRCYDFLSTNGSLFDRQESVTPTSLDALGDAYSLGLILLESIISRVVFFLPLEYANPCTNNNPSLSNSRPSEQNASQKHNIYLFKMRMLFIQTYKRQIYDLFLSYCTVCGYTLSPNTTIDAFRAKVNLHLHNLLEPNSDDHSSSLSPEVEKILMEEGPDLTDFVSCCIKIRFGHETGRETELMEFARTVGNCLSLSLTERSTTAQLSNLKLFRGDKAHAQHVLGDCSTLGADGARLKLDYAALCSCLGISKFVQNLRRYLPTNEVEEVTKQLQGKLVTPSSLLLLFEDVKLSEKVSNSATSGIVESRAKGIKR
ncbi:Kinase [Giardia lamblia P15]|uniref:Kinase n=1 Tax=Giardia intestinalis (strain P15) TaxID=658858 RepID=E1F285_GIAIA|nr:Kinase [Giardia lamblia P15]